MTYETIIMEMCHILDLGDQNGMSMQLRRRYRELDNLLK